MKRQASEQDDNNDAFATNASSHAEDGNTGNLDGQLDHHGEKIEKPTKTSESLKTKGKGKTEDARIATIMGGEPNLEDVTALIASEMNNLTLEERKAVYDDVHGVNITRQEETPEAVASWLQDFKDAVRKIRYKPEYEKAAFLNPDYVLDPKIALMFLRSADYNPRQAARRIVNHYKHKMELFGIDNLARPITFDDLDKEDRHAALTGFYQKLYLPDQSGRPVIISFPHLMDFRSRVNQIRALWYFLMAALQDDEHAQRKGFVAVAYCAGIEQEKLPVARFDLESELGTLLEGIPCKIRGCHFCYDNVMTRPLLAVMQMAVGSDIRLRARTHYGSHQECKYALMTFGIPVSVWPLGEDHRMNMEGFDQMIMILRQQEEEQIASERTKESCGMILFPKCNDVLLGRGRPYQDFPGNLRLASIVDEHRDEYKSLSKRDKPVYTDRIVRLIKEEYHGRFLKKVIPLESSNDDNDDDNTVVEFFHWVEVDDEIAKDKVGHSFRTTPKKKPLSTNHLSGSGEMAPGESWQNDDAEEDYPASNDPSQVILTTSTRAPRSNKRVKGSADDTADNSSEGSNQDYQDSDLELLDGLP